MHFGLIQARCLRDNACFQDPLKPLEQSQCYLGREGWEKEKDC